MGDTSLYLSCSSVCYVLAGDTQLLSYL